MASQYGTTSRRTALGLGLGLAASALVGFAPQTAGAVTLDLSIFHSERSAWNNSGSLSKINETFKAVRDGFGAGRHDLGHSLSG